jgi:hypothetical protein
MSGVDRSVALQPAASFLADTNTQGRAAAQTRRPALRRAPSNRRPLFIATPVAPRHFFG